jgi:hypothetical protein
MGKKLITFIIILTSLLILNIKTDTATAQVTGVIVDPSLIEFHTNATGQQFTIAVKIVNVVNLYGFDIQFKWDTKYLEYVSRSVRVPKDDYPDGVLYKPILPIKDEVNTTAGTYWIAIASMWPAPTFNGSGTAFTMTFRVKYHPVQPEPDANITLELYSTELAAIGGNPIPHYRQNGKVILYALPAPVQKHDIAVLSVNPLKTIVGQGYTMNINVTVANQGDYTETFNITIYANTTTIQTRQVTLANKTSTTITCTWNTIGYTKGNYTLWAYAWPVQGETDTADNTLSGGWVIVAMVGDLTSPNGWPDGKVDARDIALVCKYFGWMPYKPRYNPNTDINNDGKTDAKDIGIVCKQFGKKDP